MTKVTFAIVFAFFFSYKYVYNYMLFQFVNENLAQLFSF
jgi:hypothetical protein